MAQIKYILLYQWKTYFRNVSIKRKTHRRFFFIIFLYLPFLIFPFIQFILETKEELIKSTYDNLTILFIGILLYWVLLPLMAKEIYLNLSVLKLSRFPISTIKLYVIRISGVFIQPVSWIGIIGFFPLIYLSYYTITPFSFFLTSFVFSILCIQIMLLISFISKQISKTILLFSILLIFLLSIEPILSISSFQTLKDSVFLEISNLFVFNYYIFISILILMLVILIIINYFLFVKTSFKLLSIKEKRSCFSYFIKISGKLFNSKLSNFIKKDVSYLFKNRNYYLTVFITLLYFKYILFDKNPSEYSFFILMFFLIIPSVTFALNIFGLETNEGINRIIIFPVKGYEIILSKNVSYLMFIVIQMSPFLMLSLWKFGFNVFIFGLIQMFSMILIQSIVGNHFSILNPEKFEFYRLNFGSLHMGFSQLLLFYLTYIEVIRSVGVFRDTNGNGIIKQILFLLIYFIIYVFQLKYQGNKLDNNLDYIKERLS